MAEQMFLGALVLDISDRTDTGKVAALFNMLGTPFDSTVIADLITDTSMRHAMVQPSDIASGFSMVASTVRQDRSVVPAKHVTAYGWLAGTCTNAADVLNHVLRRHPKAKQFINTNQQFALVQALLHVGSACWPYKQFPNYTSCVHERVTNLLEGSYAASAITLGRSATLALCRGNDRPLYLSFVNLDRCLILVWSSKQNAVRQIVDASLPASGMSPEWEAEYRNLWIQDAAVFTEGRNTITINPMYLLSKVRKLGVYCGFNQVKVMTRTEELLRRSAI